jgi:hypothetical protein
VMEFVLGNLKMMPGMTIRKKSFKLIFKLPSVSNGTFASFHDAGTPRIRTPCKSSRGDPILPFCAATNPVHPVNLV